MQYQLAKRLQDAGFPQNGAGTRVASPDAIVARRDDFAYVPTLEELIEAVGDDFSHLNRTNRGWAAFGDNGIFGATPGEALALLWLSLHPLK